MRTEVEWGYEKVVTNWAYVDFYKKMKISEAPVESLWQLAAWLSNVLTCARRGNQISDWFHIEPPSLFEYLRVTLRTHDGANFNEEHQD